MTILQSPSSVKFITPMLLRSEMYFAAVSNGRRKTVSEPDTDWLLTPGPAAVK